ncbi:MAG: TolC family protein [Candidatus Omnitrophota bacterium]|nr:TolC family protein [Candidatus Omnitrophota bacterium]
MKNIPAIILIMLSSVFFIFCSGLSAAERDGEDMPGFEDIKALSLDECVRYSIYNSFEVKLARLDLLIAETDKMYAESVFDAFLFGSATYAEDKRQPISIFGGDDKQENFYSAGITKELLTGTELTAEWSDTRDWVNTPFVTRNPSHSAELTLEARQPVGKNFFGYIDRTNLSVTKLAIKNADLEMKDRIEDYIAKTEKAYWKLVFVKRTVDLRKNIADQARKLCETNKKNYNIGLIEKGPYYAAEANVIIRETDLGIAENNFRRAEENLKLIMNMPDPYRILPTDSFHREDIEYNLVECLNEAFEKRRDYKIRKRDVKIKNLTLKMRDNAKWPEIDLVATMAMNGVEGTFKKAFGKTTVADNTYYYAGVEVTIPVENREARSEYKKAAYEKEKAILAMKETERTIITEVGNSFRDLMTYNTSVSNMSEAVRLQSEKLEEEVKRFKYGRSWTKVLIDYQQDLLNAEMKEAIEFLARENACVELEKDMNVLFDKYEETL